MAFITTNADKAKLGPRLSELISVSKSMDMLVGFFYFSGVKVIEEQLLANKEIKLRILVGMEIEQLGRSLIECETSGLLVTPDQSRAGIQGRFLESLRKAVRHPSMDNQAFVDRLQTFVQLLEEGRLEIRKTLKPNHSKLYLFQMNEEHQKTIKHSWITGSSNFSLPGLSLQDEFNVEITNFGYEEAQKYFDDLWDKAVPLDEIYDEIRRILLEESVAATITPYEAYYLVVKHYLEVQESKLDEVKLEKLLDNAGMKKYAYQVDAVRLALTRLKEHRGCIIADVVGLGKSIIASLVAALSNKNGIIIAPPGLCGDRMKKDSGWYGYIDKFGLNGRWEAFSRGCMSDILEYVKKTPNIEMVIVDEAHWYRNETTDDYGALSLICANKEVVLLTATPFNNNPSDLYALLKLFTPARSTNYVIGKNLEQLFIHFKSKYRIYNRLERAISAGDLAEIEKSMELAGIDRLSLPKGDITNFEALKKKLAALRKKLSNAIKEVLEKVAIRRNRIDLLNDPDYSKEITTLSDVEKPKEQFFELTEAQNAFYDKVINEYFGGANPRFKGAIYQPQTYKKDRIGEEAYQENIYKMQLHRLVMRFESSFGAFKASLENTVTMMRYVQRFVEEQKCFLYSRKAMEEILNAEENEVVGLMASWIDKLNQQFAGKQHTKDPIYNMDPSKFRVKEFKADIASDIQVFDELIEQVKALELATNDPKAAALIQSIQQILTRQHVDIPDTKDVEKRKVIIFSIYQDTVMHLKPLLEKAFGSRLLCVTSLGKANLKTLKQNFDASTDFLDQRDDYDILLATDKLSEGHNLNRAGIVINYDIPWNPTRVIQRVGRINRIGKKVFDKLYIFNYYPTKKGSTIAQNRQIAEAKMMAIHQILGEDACIFSEDETPTAAGLFTKLNEPLDNPDELSFFTRMKRVYREEMLPSLTEKQRAKLDHLSPRVKTASEKKPHGVFSFKRQGSSFFAIVHSPGEGISEWTMEDAIQAIACGKNTKRIEHSAEFWSTKEKPGLYEEVTSYTPQIEGATNNQCAIAAGIINNTMDRLPVELREFAKMVVEDLTSYGTLSANKVNKITKLDFNNNPSAIKQLVKELEEVRDVAGEYYLREIKAKAERDAVIVTIEQR